MASYANDDPKKTDFGVFPNNYAKSSKAPEFVGTVEINRELLKTMVGLAKQGEFPIKLNFAMWHERTSKNGNPWRSAKLSIHEKKEEVDEPREKEVSHDSEEDDMPW